MFHDANEERRAEEIGRGGNRKRKGESVEWLEEGGKMVGVASTLNWLQRPPAMNQLI